jgi:hypothetical protein
MDCKVMFDSSIPTLGEAQVYLDAYFWRSFSAGFTSGIAMSGSLVVAEAVVLTVGQLFGWGRRLGSAIAP